VHSYVFSRLGWYTIISCMNDSAYRSFVCGACTELLWPHFSYWLIVGQESDTPIASFADILGDILQYCIISTHA
jgi:hypothetical protein